jgi:Protein of unknown function (DUF3168)
MSMETLVFDALKGLTAKRVFPDVAPENSPLPYITYQQVGGDSTNYLAQSVPDKRNARVQVNVWATTREAASSLALQVETAMRLAPTLNTTVLGASIATYDQETTYRGTRQDFSIWT